MTKDDLEMFIDRRGLSSVLFMIAEICHEKADHVESVWQDRALAHEWIKDAMAVERLAAKDRLT